MNDRREGAILVVSAGISHVSDVTGLDGVLNFFLNFVESWKKGVNISYSHDAQVHAVVVVP